MKTTEDYGIYGREDYREDFTAEEQSLFEETLALVRDSQEYVPVEAGALRLEAGPSGLCMVLPSGGEAVPVRAMSRVPLEEKLGIGGSILKKLDLESYAGLMNREIIPAQESGRLLRLFMQTGAVTGVLTGAYAPVPALDIYNNIKSFLSKRFPGSYFTGAFLSQEAVSAQWSLEAHSGEFSRIMPDGLTYGTGLRMETSDAGLHSITLRPYLSSEGADLFCPPVHTVHRGGVTLTDFDDALERTYAHVTKSTADIAALALIAIKHPKTALLRVMKAHRTPKYQGLCAAEMFAAVYAGSECTALDIYRAVCSAVAALPAGTPARTLFRAADDAAGVIAIRDWSAYDLPGDFSW